MPHSTPSTGLTEVTDQGPERALETDFSRVLVVGRSQINRVVIARIVERSGLKPTSEPPESAVRAMEQILPGIVVLDGGPDNKDCDMLLSDISALRRASGKPRPSVILVANRNGTAASLELPSVVDAVVVKPITPERLQPVIDRFLGPKRRGSPTL